MGEIRMGLQGAVPSVFEKWKGKKIIGVDINRVDTVC